MIGLNRIYLLYLFLRGFLRRVFQCFGKVQGFQFCYLFLYHLYDELPRVWRGVFLGVSPLLTGVRTRPALLSYLGGLVSRYKYNHQQAAAHLSNVLTGGLLSFLPYAPKKSFSFVLWSLVFPYSNHRDGYPYLSGGVFLNGPFALTMSYYEHYKHWRHRCQ